MLTSALARTDVILTGQCECHFTTSFSANIMPFMSDRERASPPSTEISFLTFVVKKKYTMKLSGVSISLENRRENVN